MTVPVLQCLAAILIAIAAFFCSCGARPWPAQSPAPTPVFASPARRAPARCCSRARTTATSKRRGSAPTSTSRSSRPDRPRPRHPDLPQPDRRLGRGGLRLSAARGRRGRHAEDGDRRPHRGRRHQGAAAGARASTSRRRPTGQKASLIEQERPNIFTNSVANIGPRRNRAGADRISGAGAPVRRRVLAARAAGRRRRATIPAPIVQTRRLRRRRRRLGPDDPIRCRTATASRRRCSTRASMRRSIRSPSPCACRPASRSAR